MFMKATTRIGGSTSSNRYLLRRNLNISSTETRNLHLLTNDFQSNFSSYLSINFAHFISRLELDCRFCWDCTWESFLFRSLSTAVLDESIIHFICWTSLAELNFLWTNQPQCDHQTMLINIMKTVIKFICEEKITLLNQILFKMTLASDGVASRPMIYSRSR